MYLHFFKILVRLAHRARKACPATWFSPCMTGWVAQSETILGCQNMTSYMSYFSPSYHLWVTVVGNLKERSYNMKMSFLLDFLAFFLAFYIVDMKKKGHKCRRMDDYDRSDLASNIATASFMDLWISYGCNLQQKVTSFFYNIW